MSTPNPKGWPRSVEPDEKTLTHARKIDLARRILEARETLNNAVLDAHRVGLLVDLQVDRRKVWWRSDRLPHVDIRVSDPLSEGEED